MLYGNAGKWGTVMDVVSTGLSSYESAFPLRSKKTLYIAKKLKFFLRTGNTQINVWEMAHICLKSNSYVMGITGTG